MNKQNSKKKLKISVDSVLSRLDDFIYQIVDISLRQLFLFIDETHVYSFLKNLTYVL